MASMACEDFMRPRRLALCTALLVSAAAFAAGCSSNGNREGSATGAGPASVIRITGSDTMVNLVQAWAESYRKKRPDLSVQVAGGGSGVGIAGLIDGILDIAAASREMEPSEIERAAQKNGTKPVEHTVALDALSVYVHKANPLNTISLDELAEVYGEEGTIDKWTQLGVKNAGCTKDDIIRVSRQNSSGTYVYFREAVLGKTREYKQGSIDQSGSKDVVNAAWRGVATSHITTACSMKTHQKDRIGQAGPHEGQRHGGEHGAAAQGVFPEVSSRKRSMLRTAASNRPSSYSARAR